MSGNFTDYQANAWLAEAGPWVALHFDHPEQAGAYASEIGGGGYGRELTAWTAPSNRTIWNSSTLTYTGLVASTVAYLCGWDSEFDGNLTWWTQLATPRQISNGQGFVVTPNQISLSFG